METEREAVGEWTSEGGFERVNGQGLTGPHPLSIGARMMVRVASGHFAGNVNLGGIAEVYNAFVPCIWGRGVFRIPNEPGV